MKKCKAKAVSGSTSQGGLTCWHGMTMGNLAKFFALRPPMHWSQSLKIASLFPLSVYNSLFRGLSELLYSRRVQATELVQPPIFVLGHWRSGTTLLHNLIAGDSRYTFPNMYHVVFPEHFLLTESVVTTLTAPFVIKKRPMDNMPCGWGLPQEDEIGLMQLNLLSPYLMLAFHSNLEVYERYYELSDLSSQERELWKSDFLRFLKMLTVREQRPIVLKSPTHTFRVRLLLEMFPDARFIYLVRNPYDVVVSTMHLRRTLFNVNGLCPFDETGLEEDVLDTYEHMFRVFERDRALIPENQLAELRFEDLEEDPIYELRRIYRQLDLFDFEPRAIELEPQVEKLKSFKKNRYNVDDDLLTRIYDRLQPAFQEYGYSQDDTSELTQEQRNAISRFPIRQEAGHQFAGDTRARLA